VVKGGLRGRERGGGEGGGGGGGGGERGMEVVRKRKCRKLVEGKRGMEGWLAGYF